MNLSDYLLERPNVVWFVVLTVLTVLGAIAMGLEQRQVVAVAIMLSFIYGTLLFWRLRLAFALLGTSVLFLAGVLDTKHFVQFASLDIIVFLVGMMIIVGYLEKNHFFEHVLSHVMRLAGRSTTRLIVLLMVLAAVFAALVDEVTSILFMTGLVLHLTGRLNLNPVPFVLMLVFATNVGSSATVVGNPVGVMVALKGGLTFNDFLRWATPITLVSLAVLIPLCLRLFREDIGRLREAMRNLNSGELFHAPAHGHVLPSALLFLAVITALVLHAPLEAQMGLPKNTLLLATAFLGAALVLFAEGNEAQKLVETRVDWWTLLFFLFLFSSVGALEFVGVTERLAHGLNAAVGTEPVVTLAMVMLSTGILSALLDNVLAVAVFIPVVNQLATLGGATNHLWWAMLFGGTLFGNLTVIGSTANIIAVGLLERRKVGSITFNEWVRPGAVIVAVTTLVAFLGLYLQLAWLTAG